jgi:hypothetical protein
MLQCECRHVRPLRILTVRQAKDPSAQCSVACHMTVLLVCCLRLFCKLAVTIVVQDTCFQEVSEEKSCLLF